MERMFSNVHCRELGVFFSRYLCQMFLYIYMIQNGLSALLKNVLSISFVKRSLCFVFI